MVPRKRRTPYFWDMRRFQISEVRRVFQGFFAVDQATVAYERTDGTMSEAMPRLSVERGDAVGLIVLEVEADRLLFVKQFRYPMARHGDAWPVECVAGGIDADESEEDAARRELFEELGYVPEDLHLLDRCYSSPGGLSEMVTLFFTRVSTAHASGDGGGLAHEGEDVERVELSREEVREMLRMGRFRDAKTIVGLYSAIAKGFI